MKKILAVLLALAMIFSIAACGTKQEPAPQPEASTTPTIDAIKAAGKLVIGTSADYPPYEFHVMNNGQDEIVGFEIALAQYAADKLGVELEIVDMAFDGLLISLDGGDFDCVFAGLTPTEERKQACDFTDVVIENEQIIIIRKDCAETYKTGDDLKGTQVGYQKGTVQEEIAHRFVEDSGCIGLTKFPDLIQELKEGTLEAVFTNTLVATAYVTGNEDLMIQDIGIDYDNKGFSIAVQKGNADLVEFLNEVIKEVHDNGEFDKFVADAQALADASEQ